MKITPDHLTRGAFIYIRQSTIDQVTNNHEVGCVNMALPIVPVLWAGRM